MKMVGITGHQEAPREAWRLLHERLPEVLGIRPFVGVSSLAAGADQEFSDIVLARGGALRVVLPCANYEQSFASVEQRTRYQRLICAAAWVEQLDFPFPSEDAYLAAGRRVVDRTDTLVALWDGKPAKGKGGTADIVKFAQTRGKPVVIIWPEGLAR